MRLQFGMTLSEFSHHLHQKTKTHGPNAALTLRNKENGFTFDANNMLFHRSYRSDHGGKIVFYEDTPGDLLNGLYRAQDTLEKALIGDQEHMGRTVYDFPTQSNKITPEENRTLDIPQLEIIG